MIIITIITIITIMNRDDLVDTTVQMAIHLKQYNVKEKHLKNLVWI